MTPYYEHAGITIYHGDCREILPELTADVLVTDPPYGVNFDGKATKHTTVKSGGYIGEDSTTLGPEIVNMALTLVKRAAVFPGTRLLFRYPEPADIGCVYCPSGAGIGRAGFTCFHPVLFYGPRASNKLQPSSIISFAVSEPNGHPCPKPIEWMTWIVGLVSNEDETVIDPFCGSGRTLRAAKNQNRRAIGIDIEEAYCEIAAKQMAQEVLPFQVESDPVARSVGQGE
jgi:DNA modification methylase